MAMIYKILPAADWRAMQAAGHFAGSADDRRDGFVHLSAQDQLAGTLARHFKDQTELMLLAVDDQALPAGALKWEESRGGALFPHLYGPLPLAAVRWAAAVEADGDSAPVLPARMTGDA